MKYEYQTFTSPLTGDEFEFVILEREDGSFESFPVDENNPRYLEFLGHIRSNTDGNN